VELRKWRKGKGNKEAYAEEKREYKALCDKKKMEENEKWIEYAKKAKTTEQVWEVVNRERTKRRRTGNEIEIEEWEGYFRRQLGGVGWKVVRGERRGVEDDKEEGLRKEEVGKAVKKIKDGKAVGGDGIPGEIWKYGGEKMIEWVWSICGRIWRGEGWIEEWNEGLVVPVFKKGDGNRVEDFRGITLAGSLYKIYAEVLAERLREEVEMKGLIPENQTGFRKGRGVMDNIYVLNYLVNRNISREGGKLIALFVDMRAAFDMVNREILLTAMRKRGVREGLVRRCGDLYRETRNRVRAGGKIGKGFWTGRGVRQGCPLSPILFNLVLADLEDVMKSNGWGGVKLKGRKVFSLAYADDVALLAENEEGMRGMIRCLEKYLKEKGLELNVGKTKVLRFKKGAGREKKLEWWWRGERIEEVREFRYLGFIFQRNGGRELHVKERVKKGAAVMGQVWGIGKRKFGRDWGKRLWLFDALVWSVLGFGVEVWGWKE